MGTLSVHQNIPASDIKLTHSLGIYSIGLPLVMEKLIPVISRTITSPPEMGPLLDVECKPAVIIKPRFILVPHTDHLSRNKTFNQQRQMHIQPLNWIISTPDTLPRQHTYCITDCRPYSTLWEPQSIQCYLLSTLCLSSLLEPQSRQCYLLS